MMEIGQQVKWQIGSVMRYGIVYEPGKQTTEVMCTKAGDTALALMCEVQTSLLKTV